ncbi:uncharacterized protein LOC116252065 isoform X1 [Nymphaea colorata]|nr:uncharacterized protein LOC116252065 isoform X1 [Nymphaea colorata]
MGSLNYVLYFFIWLVSRRLVAAFRGRDVPRRAFASDGATVEPSLGPQTRDDHGEPRPSHMDHVDCFDVAIVGGGMVGLALACALSSMPLTRSLRVAIVDGNPFLLRPPTINNDLPDPRVSTLTPATISFFKDICAWDFIQHHRHAFFSKMQVWDYTGLGYTRYSARDVDSEILGCVVENKVILGSLLSCLQNAGLQKAIYPAKLTSMVLPSCQPSLEGAKSSHPDQNNMSYEASRKRNVQQFEQQGHLVKLDLSDGTSLYTKLVVGADGSKSRVREVAGFKTTGWNYSQDAVICTVEHAYENDCAWQRFLPSGPLALLPIGDRFSNIVWSMTSYEASTHKSMSEVDFVNAVNSALIHGYGPHPGSTARKISLDSFFGGMGTTQSDFEIPPEVHKLVTERFSFPLSLMHARDYVSNRIALVGDAAHTIHPLAGQGVNLGFGDAHALAKVLAEGILVGSDIGAVSLLKKYEKERKLANLTMMAIMDGFQKAFSIDAAPLNILRAIAFQSAQHFGPLKRNIISYAMGEKKLPLLF